MKKRIRETLTERVLEKFMANWERRVERGEVQPVTAGERMIIEVFIEWLVKKYELKEKEGQ